MLVMGDMSHWSVIIKRLLRNLFWETSKTITWFAPWVWAQTIYTGLPNLYFKNNLEIRTNFWMRKFVIFSSKKSAAARVSEDFMPNEPTFQTLHIAAVAFNSSFWGDCWTRLEHVFCKMNLLTYFKFSIHSQPVMKPLEILAALSYWGLS